MDQLQRMVVQALMDLGLYLQVSWVQACMDHLRGSRSDWVGLSARPNQLLEAVIAQALFADFRECGAVHLPPGIQTWHNQVLQGKHVLQIDEVVDMGAAARDRYIPRSGSHCLKLHLTDGHQRVCGIEFNSIPGLSWDCPAGTKVVVENVRVKRGVLMLQPQNMAPLGGQVQALEAARQRALAVWNLPPCGRKQHEGPRDVLGEARAAALGGDGSLGAGAAPLLAPPPLPMSGQQQQQQQQQQHPPPLPAPGHPPAAAWPGPSASGALAWVNSGGLPAGPGPAAGAAQGGMPLPPLLRPPPQAPQPWEQAGASANSRGSALSALAGVAAGIREGGEVRRGAASMKRGADALSDEGAGAGGLGGLGARHGGQQQQLHPPSVSPYQQQALQQQQQQHILQAASLPGARASGFARALAAATASSADEDEADLQLEEEEEEDGGRASDDELMRELDFDIPAAAPGPGQPPRGAQPQHTPAAAATLGAAAGPAHPAATAAPAASAPAALSPRAATAAMAAGVKGGVRPRPEAGAGAAMGAEPAVAARGGAVRAWPSRLPSRSPTHRRTSGSPSAILGASAGACGRVCSLPLQPSSSEKRRQQEQQLAQQQWEREQRQAAPPKSRRPLWQEELAEPTQEPLQQGEGHVQPPQPPPAPPQQQEEPLQVLLQRLPPLRQLHERKDDLGRPQPAQLPPQRQAKPLQLLGHRSHLHGREAEVIEVPDSSDEDQGSGGATGAAAPQGPPAQGYGDPQEQLPWLQPRLHPQQPQQQQVQQQQQQQQEEGLELPSLHAPACTQLPAHCVPATQMLPLATQQMPEDLPLPLQPQGHPNALHQEPQLQQHHHHQYQQQQQQQQHTLQPAAHIVLLPPSLQPPQEGGSQFHTPPTMQELQQGCGLPLLTHGAPGPLGNGPAHGSAPARVGSNHMGSNGVQMASAATQPGSGREGVQGQAGWAGMGSGVGAGMDANTQGCVGDVAINLGPVAALRPPVLVPPAAQVLMTPAPLPIPGARTAPNTNTSTLPTTTSSALSLTSRSASSGSGAAASGSREDKGDVGASAPAGLGVSRSEATEWESVPVVHLCLLRHFRDRLWIPGTAGGACDGAGPRVRVLGSIHAVVGQRAKVEDGTWLLEVEMSDHMMTHSLGFGAQDAERLRSYNSDPHANQAERAKLAARAQRSARFLQSFHGLLLLELPAPLPPRPVPFADGAGSRGACSWSPALDFAQPRGFSAEEGLPRLMGLQVLDGRAAGLRMLMAQARHNWHQAASSMVQ